MDSFPPPSPDDKAAKSIHPMAAKRLNVNTRNRGVVQNMWNKYYEFEGSHKTPPPENWPTESAGKQAYFDAHDEAIGEINDMQKSLKDFQSKYNDYPASKKIKSTTRGGAGAGRGDNPHHSNDDAPPYGMPRPKL